MCLTASVGCASIMSSVECVEIDFHEYVGGVSQAMMDKGIHVIPTRVDLN